jgi:acyl-CoA synthetase (AMP-forming)/AMP-acid ligase II
MARCAPERPNSLTHSDGACMQLLTLGDLWARNARLYPDAEALVCGHTRRTYTELLQRGRRLASALHALGVVRQDRVSLLARNRAEWFDYYAACELHGYVAATLNFRLAVDELVYILEDSDSRLVIFEYGYADLVNELRSRVSRVRTFVCIGDGPPWARRYETLLDEGDANGPPFVAAAEDSVRLIYTSGTTGRPKGVVRGQRADLALARICAETSEMPGGCRELIMMPMFHIGAQSMASGAHWAGGCVVLQRDFDVRALLKLVQTEQVDTMHLTPTILQSIFDEASIDTFDLSSLRTVVYAAAPMSVPLLKRGLAQFGKIFANCYGSTEVGAAIVLAKRFHNISDTADLERLGSLGQEHADSRVRILDEEGSECPLGVVGEIAIRTDAMMNGYWNNAKATSAALKDGWFRSGDIGLMDEQGFVFLVDRKSDMIISGGENIYSREVEIALLSHPEVAQVAVIGVADEHWGQSVKAVVVRVAGSELDAEALTQHCRKKIARYKAPKSIEFVSKLPLLPSAKIDKVALRKHYGTL